MEAERFMELYDSCWFNMEILKKEQNLSKSSSFEANPDDGVEEKAEAAAAAAAEPKIFRAPTILERSMSDQLSFQDSTFAFSPDSVLLTTPKLQTIHSGKEIVEEEENPATISVQESPNKRRVHTRRRKTAKNSKTTSRSLSELEFEELKGFMDLGFVFSEEDKDSSLVSIIPGLQRLGKKTGEETQENVVVEETAVSRPYLSEAWEVLERKRKERPLTNWRLPSLNNEIDLKDNLRSWAHTVASAVR